MFTTSSRPSSTTRPHSPSDTFGAAENGTSRDSWAPGVPEPYTPPRCAVPPFPPIHAGGRGGRRLLRRTVRRRRKALAIGLALTAAALAASTAHSAAPRPARAAPRGPVATVTHHAPREALVRAPVRIADAAVAGLLHPGNRVDVLAGAHVVAASVTVVSVPEASGLSSPSVVTADGTGAGGALVVLAVPRRIAASLSGAATSSPLAVTLC
jgi:hypothetical protein